MATRPGDGLSSRGDRERPPLDTTCGPPYTGWLGVNERSQARATAHVEVLEDDPGKAGHTLDLALATARAFGAALAECVRVDPRRAGAVASSKGTLSL